MKGEREREIGMEKPLAHRVGAEEVPRKQDPTYGSNGAAAFEKILKAKFEEMVRPLAENYMGSKIESLVKVETEEVVKATMEKFVTAEMEETTKAELEEYAKTRAEETVRAELEEVAKVQVGEIVKVKTEEFLKAHREKAVKAKTGEVIKDIARRYRADPETTLFAPVLRWNDRVVVVRCPFCKAVHRHSMKGGLAAYTPDADGIIAHCSYGHPQSMRYYRFQFPFAEKDETEAHDNGNGASRYTRGNVQNRRTKFVEYEIHQYGHEKWYVNVEEDGRKGAQSVESSSADDMENLTMLIEQKLKLNNNATVSPAATMPVAAAAVEMLPLPLTSGDRRSNVYCYTTDPVTGSDEILLYAPIARFQISTPWKTVARLVRGGRFPTIDAMSGWSHAEGPYIHGRFSTLEVKILSLMIGYKLPASPEYDQGSPGMFNASHAEKQLVSYFVDKHVFLEQNFMSEEKIESERQKIRKDLEIAIDLDPKFISTDQLSLKDFEKLLVRCKDSWPQLSTLDSQSRLRKLYEVRPPIMLRDATILVSKEPCCDCQQFIGHVNRSLGLNIRVEYITKR